jgi:ABC-type multidrug transport system ATPase subunit
MLEINELSYRIGNALILDDLHLNVPAGQYYALAGENGAGKSTLIKIILDLIRGVQRGVIYIDGQSNRNLSSRNVIAYLPEKFNIIKEVTGWQYLRFIYGMYQKKLSQERVITLCDALCLDYSRLDHKIGDYSKGMLQKLGLVSCFMLDSSMVILDEPLSGLDPGARFSFKQLLKQEREYNRTIFYSTHLLADAEEICDRFGILHQGRIVFDGTPAECINRYQTNTLEQAYMSCISETETE